MTFLRVAPVLFLAALSVAGCECGRGGDVAEDASTAQAPSFEPLAPVRRSKPAEASPAALDDVAGGGSVASPARAERARSSSPGASALRSLERLFDGDALVVVRNGARRIACDKACSLEDQCGFRDAAACRAASCDGDVRIASRMDYCLALDDSVTCLDAAACSCAESCWKRGECAKDHGDDDDCERSCRILVNVEGERRYRENRCVLENRCDRLVVCSNVNGP